MAGYSSSCRPESHTQTALPGSELQTGWGLVQPQVYACDLAYKLFENENINASFFYDTIQAKKWLSEHFDDLSEIIEELQFQFDKDFCNKIMLDFFNNPDCFIVVIVLEVASYLLGQCKYINENWDDEIILTNDVIDTICQQLDEL